MRTNGKNENRSGDTIAQDELTSNASTGHIEIREFHNIANESAKKTSFQLRTI